MNDQTRELEHWKHEAQVLGNSIFRLNLYCQQRKIGKWGADVADSMIDEVDRLEFINDYLSRLIIRIQDHLQTHNIGIAGQDVTDTLKPNDPLTYMFNVGDLVRVPVDHMRMEVPRLDETPGTEWVVVPIKWSKGPFRIYEIEDEGRRLIVENEPPTKRTGRFGETAKWCKPYQG